MIKRAYFIVSKEVDYHLTNYYKNLKKIENSSWFIIAPASSGELNGFEIINENEILEKNKILNQLKSICNNSSFKYNNCFNWYYQQFLKYAIVLKYDYFDKIWIIDGDTYLSYNLIENDFIPYGRQKINLEYETVIKKLGFQIESNKCHVYNYMVFNPNILKSLFDKIGVENINGFISRIKDLTIEDKIKFSEYQLYANFAIKEGENLKKIKAFRRYDLISSSFPDNFNSYDFISIEKNHNKNFLKKFIAKVFWTLQLSIE